jgi:hypothetical protein
VSHFGRYGSPTGAVSDDGEPASGSHSTNIVAWLQFRSAGCAFVAAGFWIWSAAGKAPKMTFAEIDNLEPWLDQSARRKWRHRSQQRQPFLLA